MSLYEPSFAASWPSRSLWETAEWTNGLAFRAFAFSDDGDPVIKIAELKGGISGQTKFTRQTFDPKYRVVPGDVLYSWSGSPETSLDVFVWDGPAGWLNQHIFKVEVTEGLDRNFHIQLLRYLRPNLVAIATNKQTTGLGHVTQKDMRRMVVAIPPLDEQRRIAAVLGALDDKIELNRKMNRTLEEMAQAIFKSWFIDFDGYDDLVDSEIGPVPRGWEVGTLGDLADLNPESWNKRTRPASISYVDLSNTKWGAIEAVTEFQAGDAPSRAQRVLRPRDTIVGTVRPGNGSYALVARSGLTGSTGFAVLRPKDSESASMIYLAATRRENIDRLAHLADGGAYPAVRPEIVAATPTVVPPASVLGDFAASVDPLLQRMATNRAESRTLADLRDTLLPKLISGELRVPEAEATVEASLGSRKGAKTPRREP